MKYAIRLFALFSLIAVLSCAAFALPSAVTTGDTAAEQSFDVADADEKALLLVGEGTEASPYMISSASDFNNYAKVINKSGSVYADKYYQLSSNIDFAGCELTPFGVSETLPFMGTIDGNGYALLNVSVPDIQCSGVIGFMTQGTVKNLRVSYSDMTQYKGYSNLKFFGGIAGCVTVASSGSVNVSGCTVEGTLMLDVANAAYAAGVFGKLRCEKGNAYVSDCVTNVNFDIKSQKSHYVAGFSGHAVAGSNKKFEFKNSVSYGNVKAVTPYVESTVAGFSAYVNVDESGWSGWAEDQAVLMSETFYPFENCAAYGNIYGESKSKAMVGGFIGCTDGGGTIKVNNCYKNASATVAGVSKSVASNNLAASTSKENFDSETFYESVLKFDFTDGMYMSGGKVQIRDTAKSYGAGTVSEAKDLRLTSIPGLRFLATLDATQRDYCFEYGFIIARKDELGDNELTFDFEGRKIHGVGFDSKTDKFIEKDDTTVTISGVIINIPKEHYGVELVARTYAKFTNSGETVIVYGNQQSSSINLSAASVRNSEGYDNLTDEQKTLLETMLPKA